MAELTYKTEAISSDAATHLVNTATGLAKQMGVSVAVAVLDNDGQLKAFHRMDRTPVIAVETVQAKARAALMGLSTEELGEALADSLPNLISMVTLKDMTLLSGGVPLRSGDVLIGSIGVGGALADQDAKIAEAAAASLEDFVAS